MSHYYNRKGDPITLLEWSESYQSDQQRVAEDNVGPWWVSTVWLGLNHQYGDGPPLIFETMIFPKNGDDINYDGHYSERYSTEAEAIEGHKRAVAWANTHTPPARQWDGDDDE